MIDPLDLAGVSEIAEELGVRANVVSNWIKRHPDFPRPLVTLKMGPIFSLKAVKAWHAERERTPACPRCKHKTIKTGPYFACIPCGSRWAITEVSGPDPS